MLELSFIFYFWRSSMLRLPSSPFLKNSNGLILWILLLLNPERQELFAITIAGVALSKPSNSSLRYVRLSRKVSILSHARAKATYEVRLQMSLHGCLPCYQTRPSQALTPSQIQQSSRHVTGPLGTALNFDVKVQVT